MDTSQFPVLKCQEQLRAETLLRALVNAAPDPIIALDRAGHVIMWNPAAERVFGWTAAEILKQSNPLVPDHARPEYDFLRSRTVSGEVIAVGEGRRQRRDGGLVDVRISTAPLRDDSGEMCGTMMILTDITQQKRLESQFLQAQKMEAIGQLAGGIAHDFNNLLTPILGYGHLLLDRLRANPELVADLGEIVRAGERARDLTRQLLGFSRKQPRNLQVLSLNRCIKDAAAMLARLLGDDIHLRVMLEDTLGHVKLDHGYFQQILMNLLVNARDAMPRGGVVTIATANVTLDEQFALNHPGATPGRYVSAAIGDSGSGMTPAILSRVFEPFFTTKPPGKGTGLGMAMVYGVVRQSGGYVTVDSAPGAGTTVTIYFRRADEAQDVAPQPDSSASLGGSETVLVAEDESSVRDLIRRTLQARGYRVLSGSDGLEALAIGERHPGPIDLLLSDVTMPGLAGPDLAQQLLRNRPTLKVLFISGFAQPLSDNHNRNTKISFLPKPFTPNTLARKVREGLDGEPDGRRPHREDQWMHHDT